MAELSDDEIKKLPPAVREGFEKAKRAKEGDDNPYSKLGDMFGDIFGGKKP